MRRLQILFHWLFTGSNNVSFLKLVQFLLKPKVETIAKRFIKGITESEKMYFINFVNIGQKLYWPKEYQVDGIYQVVSETFDVEDWHYYQKKNTVVLPNEVILDVGAAEGLFALSVVGKCRQIILVEPNDYFFDALKITFESFSEKVILHNLAVGNMEGEISFDENSLSGKVGSNEGSIQPKQITTIDKLLPPDKQITYLKADLEGYELEMLKGARATIRRNKPKIAITCYHTENDAMEIIREIKDAVPEYQYYVKGIHHDKGKPVMIHFWIDKM